MKAIKWFRLLSCTLRLKTTLHILLVNQNSDFYLITKQRGSKLSNRRTESVAHSDQSQCSFHFLEPFKE